MALKSFSAHHPSGKTGKGSETCAVAIASVDYCERKVWDFFESS